MSFSGMVKEELSKRTGASRHCQIAEIAAILSLCGGIQDCRNCSIAQCLWQNDCRRDTAVSDRK